MLKPLVLKYEQAAEIEKIAYEKGFFVGVEYHKRFDRRSLMAKRSCELKHFGEFVMGEAKLIEPYYYRSSNFQNWFTCDKTDPFVYIGCHYVDLVYFITGLKPVSVSVSGIKGKFPNGNEGYMWANGRVRFENNAILSVIDGLGYPDQAAGIKFLVGNSKSKIRNYIWIRRSTPMSRTLTFHIFRYNPQDSDSQPHMEDFQVEETDSLTLYLDPEPHREEQDSSLQFDFCCRAGICGSWAMMVNGRPDLACHTKTKDLPAEITLLPLPVFKLVGDLSVDTGTWFRGMNEQVQSWIHTDKVLDPTAPEERMDNRLAKRSTNWSAVWNAVVVWPPAAPPTWAGFYRGRGAEPDGPVHAGPPGPASGAGVL